MYRICRSEGIPFREVAPTWSEHEIWEEAFITSIILAFQCFHLFSIQMLKNTMLKYTLVFLEISVAVLTECLIKPLVAV